MLINALCNYHDVLAKQGFLCPYGYSSVDIDYLVCLNLDGTINEIIDWSDTDTITLKNGKKKEVKRPHTVVLPKRTEKPGIDGNIVEHRALYIFGLNYVDGAFSPDDNTDKAKKSHAAFCETNLEFISDLDSPIINAYRNFIQNWVPENECENTHLVGLGKEYSTVKFAFCLAGDMRLLLHDDPNIKQKWTERLSKNAANSALKTAQCAISGKVAPISKIHDKIRGIGAATGSTLIGFNNPSEESYCNEQSYNSNVSEDAMLKYTRALNYLLTGKAHKSNIDDITIVFWAADGNTVCDDLMAALAFDESGRIGAERTEALLANIVKSAGNGTVVNKNLDIAQDIDPNVDYYMVGLKPNVSRITVKFIYRKKFGSLMYNIAKHQDDISISKTMRPVAMWEIKRELVSPKSSDQKVDPALVSKIFDSIINGTPYPVYLLSTIITRVKTDSDYKVNSVRAGIIKACINRNSRFQNKKEELTVSLNPENHNTAYLCGRLFAVLEKLQEDASGGNLNRTIKDSYFASAASKPAMVFSKLLKLAQHHFGKVKSKIDFNTLIAEIISMLDGEFPEILSLSDQGRFIIGYYQQYKYLLAVSARNTKNEETNNNEGEN